MRSVRSPASATCIVHRACTEDPNQATQNRNSKNAKSNRDIIFHIHSCELYVRYVSLQGRHLSLIPPPDRLHSGRPKREILQLPGAGMPSTGASWDPTSRQLGHKLGYDSHAVPITLSAPVRTLTQVGGPRKETYTFPAKESDQIMRTCQSLRCLAVSTCSKNSPRCLFGSFLVTIRRRKA